MLLLTNKKVTRGSKRIVGEKKVNAPGALLGLAFALLLWVCIMPIHSQAETHNSHPAEKKLYQINVPQLNAADALNRLAEQTGVTFLFPYEVAEAQQANPVAGRFTLMQALTLLLEGSALTGGLTDSGVVVISRKHDSENGKGMGMNSKKKLLAATVGFFMGAGGASYALAEEVLGDGEKEWALEEIVVTAQKREERLIDVPISVSVMGQEEIAAKNIQDIRDLSFYVPNFTIQGSGNGVQRPIIRGVSNFTGSSSLVGVYLDEISLPNVGGFGFDMQTTDIQRVEVLKGPQGTLFGQGAAGGVVRFITNTPSFESFEGELSASGYSTKGGSVSQEYTAIANVPVIDDMFAFRVNLTYKDQGGWIDTVVPSSAEVITENANDKQVSNIRVKGLLHPTDDLKFNLMAIQYQSDTGLENNVDENNEYPLIVRNGLPFANTDIHYDYDIYNLTIEYDFGFASLISSSSKFEAVQDRSSVNLFLETLTSYFEQLGTDLEFEIEGVAQEIRLAGDSEWGHWTVGTFYADNEKNEATNEVGFYVSGVELFSVSNIKNYTGSKSIAYFSEISYDITDKLTLDLGTRYFEDKREHNSGFNLGEGNDLDPRSLQKEEFDKLSSKVSLSYSVSDTRSLYFRVAEGFRSGGFNFGSDVGFEPESLLAYELGVKSSIGRLNVDGSIYYTKYDDYQTSVVNQELLVGGVGVLNAGKAEVKGFEWSLQWMVDDNLSLAFNGAVNEAEYTELSDSVEETIKEGDSLDAIPKYSFSVSANYDFNWTSSITGFSHLSYNRQGPSTITLRGVFPQGDFSESDATGFLDMQIGAAWDRFTLKLFGNNLTNESRPNIKFFNGSDTQSRLRSIGFSGTYKF